MFVDLTYGLETDMLVYPGSRRVRVETREDDGWIITNLDISAHSGTHIDAPRHVFEDGKTIDDYPLSKFINKAYLFDARKQFLEKGELEIRIPGKYYSELRDLKLGALVIYTGYGDSVRDRVYRSEYPYLRRDSAEKLAKLENLNVVAMDTLSFDAPDEREVHEILLSRDILLCEMIVNLDRISEPIFDLYTIPLLIRRAEASPVRAFAIL